MNSKVVDLAIEAAKNSVHRHRIGAVIFKKKTIISVAYNKPFAFASNLHPKYQSYPGSIHAEVSAIISAKTDLKNCEMLIVRINKKGELRLSRPCNYCMSYIIDVGIKKITYSDNECKFHTMRIRK